MNIKLTEVATVKHFTSWCVLTLENSPKAKTTKKVKGIHYDKAGQIFKECTQGLLSSKRIAIGGFIRKLKAKKDSTVSVIGASLLRETFVYSYLV